MSDLKSKYEELKARHIELAVECQHNRIALRKATDEVMRASEIEELAHSHMARAALIDERDRLDQARGEVAREMLLRGYLPPSVTVSYNAQTDLFSAFVEDGLISPLRQRIVGSQLGTMVAQEQQDEPPQTARFLLHFLPTTREVREAILGDLIEEYWDIAIDHGVHRATIWFWWKTIASFWPFIWAKVPGLISFAKRWILR